MQSFWSRALGALLPILLVACGAAPTARGPVAPSANDGASDAHVDADKRPIQNGKAKVSLATVVEEPRKTLDDEIEAKLLKLMTEPAAAEPPPEKADEEEESPPKPKPKPKPRKKPKPKAKK